MTGFIDLPTELQRDILELTAIRYPGMAVQLVCLSRNIQQWMEAFLYHTVVLNFPLIRTQHFLQAVDSKPPTFFATKVRRLYLTDHVNFDAAKKILSVCTGLSALACWVQPGPSSLLPILPANPSFHRLSVRIHRLFEHTHAGDKYDILDTLERHPIFQNLTHLDIINPPGAPQSDLPESQSLWMDVWRSLSSLPKLEHISFDIYCPQYHRDIISTLPYLLNNCPNLETLVVVTTSHDVIDAVNTAVEDPRCHVVPYYSYPKTLTGFWDDLSTCGFGGCDFWDLAPRAGR
ncbi:hypothetical protein PM082_000432 [Marasmius tenuissimus]|nr:hypothetical protein PM082_000432 [Marasmius tenuissimus]